MPASLSLSQQDPAASLASSGKHLQNNPQPFGQWVGLRDFLKENQVFSQWNIGCPLDFNVNQSIRIHASHV